MPLDEIGGSVIGWLVRAVVQVFAEIVVELLVKGAGYLIVKYGFYLGRREVDPDRWPVVVAGLSFWGGIVALTVYAISN